MKINVRINEREDEYMRINKAKSWIYEETNGCDTLGNVHERKRRNTKINNIRNGK